MIRKTTLGLIAILSCLPLALAQSHAQPIQGVEGARLVDVLPLKGEVFHVEGVDLDQDHIWVTSVDLKNHKGYLHAFSRRTGQLERRVDVSDGPRYHPGGFSIHGGSIWVPVGEITPHSSAVLEEIDRTTLVIRRKIPVADHIGCLAVTDNALVAGNWDSRTLYVFDMDGKLIRSVANPSQTRYQDMKFEHGQLVASGYLTPLSGTIDWFSWPDLTVLFSRRAGATDRGKPYTGEGMALKGRDLYLVSEDGPSRMFHFVLAGQP